ncbi:hypothetical protein JL721_6468 [Aureococcus anophagefferens]|nr:hypothetical protein JL721_6468 [Aureococcus anophagefferens]
MLKKRPRGIVNKGKDLDRPSIAEETKSHVADSFHVIKKHGYLEKLSRGAMAGYQKRYFVLSGPYSMVRVALMDLERRLAYYLPRLEATMAAAQTALADLERAQESFAPARWFGAYLAAQDALALHVTGEVRGAATLENFKYRDAPRARRRRARARLLRARGAALTCAGDCAARADPPRPGDAARCYEAAVAEVAKMLEAAGGGGDDDGALRALLCDALLGVAVARRDLGDDAGFRDAAGKYLGAGATRRCPPGGDARATSPGPRATRR